MPGRAEACCGRGTARSCQNAIIGPVVHCRTAGRVLHWTVMSDVAELHVRPDEHSGTWEVELDTGEGVVSSHRTASEAEREARRLAAARGAGRIFVHDRYRRVRQVPVRFELTSRR